MSPVDAWLTDILARWNNPAHNNKSYREGFRDAIDLVRSKLRAPDAPVMEVRPHVDLLSIKGPCGDCTCCNGMVTAMKDAGVDVRGDP